MFDEKTSDMPHIRYVKDPSLYNKFIMMLEFQALNIVQLAVPI